MSIEVATGSFDVEHRASRIGGSRARHEDVIDRRELIEEPPESIEVSGVEGGDAGAQFEADAIDTLRVTRREDHIGTFPHGSPRGLETDPRGSADHQERLARELGFPTHAIAQLSPSDRAVAPVGLPGPPERDHTPRAVPFVRHRCDP